MRRATDSREEEWAKKSISGQRIKDCTTLSVNTEKKKKKLEQNLCNILKSSFFLFPLPNNIIMVVLFTALEP